MKTIEERALHYATVKCKGCGNEEKKGRYQGYIAGATEQEILSRLEKEKLILLAKAMVVEMVSFTMGDTPNNIANEFERKLRSMEL